MILVDSSVWIDFFRSRETRETSYLKLVLDNRLIATADLVLAEVLQGCRSEREASLVRSVLLKREPIIVGGVDIAVRAARLYRDLRARGITVRKTIDTLIATRCIADGLELLYADRDFDPFVEHFGLDPALLPTTGLN